MKSCREGGEHEVVSASVEDRERYDPTVLGQHDQWAGPRPNQLWGYCLKCLEGMRWSVGDQEWRPWPGGLALLPHLTDEELDELRDAVVRRCQELARVGQIAQGEGTREELAYKLRILMSLHTAVQEARYQLWPSEGTYAPRTWGEAWTVLDRWIDDQLAGIAQSSQNDTTVGAANAFHAMKQKIRGLEQAGDQPIAVIPAGTSETAFPELAALSGPQPTSAESD